MTPAATAATVQRRIHFYRVGRAGGADPGWTFNPTPLIRHIRGLPFTDDGRYLRASDSGRDSYAVWPWCAGGRPRLRMGLVRRSNLPQVEREGETQVLSLPASAGLLEAIHVVFSPNNLVGAEFNFHGPRLGSLARYLRDKGPPGTPELRFRPLLRRDTARQLDTVRGITLLRLRVHRSYSGLLDQLSQGLGASLEATAEATGSHLVELILKSTRRSRQPLTASVLDFVRSLAGSPTVREAAEVFRVKAVPDNGGPAEEIDLLSDQLVTVARVVRENARGRVLEAASVFDAIDDAYNDLRDELEAAPALE